MLRLPTQLLPVGKGFRKQPPRRCQESILPGTRSCQWSGMAFRPLTDIDAGLVEQSFVMAVRDG